jgi:uncharacterized protein involved in outer membrane biogenesis
MVGISFAVVGAQADVSGRWNMTIDSDAGSQSATLTLQQSGESFSGSIGGDQGTFDFDGGMISGNKLEWVLEIDAQGTFIEISMDGTVDGDQINGTMDFGGQGGGDWTARRAQ